MPQGIVATQQEAGDAKTTTTLPLSRTTPWPPTTGSSTNPNLQRGGPTNDYTLDAFFEQSTSMPGLQPTIESYGQPRTMPGLPGLDTELAPVWDTTIPSSASESTYSTPSDHTHGNRLPVRTSSGDWNTAPMVAFNSQPGTQSTSPMPGNGAFAMDLYTSPVQQPALFGETPLPGFFTDEPFFNLEQMQTNSTVRSMPPHMAMGQSSETLVTVPAVPPTDFFGGGAGCGRPEGLGLLASRSEAPDRLEPATREAIPKYLNVYWEKFYPLYPVIHKRTLSFETAATKDYFDVLRCAMAAIATQYLTDKDDRVKGSELYHYARYKSKLVRSS